MKSSNSRLSSLQKLTHQPGTSDSVQIMSTERCAELMVVSMANNLDEVWIAREPALLMAYSNQYFPNLYRWYVFRAISRIFKTTKTVNFRDDLFSTKRRQRITTRTQKGYKGQSITRNAMCHVSTFWREHPPPRVRRRG